MKLPVLQTVSTAYGAVLGRPGRFILRTVPPLIILMALWLIQLAWGPWTFSLFSIAPLVDILPYIFFGLLWFRLYLLESSESLLTRPVFGPRSLVYFAVAIIIYLLFWLPIVLFVFPALVELLQTSRTGTLPAPMTLIQGFVLLPGMFLAWCYLLGRISLLLPAMAVDGSMGPRAAWRSTAGNGLRLLAAYMLAGLPILVVYGLSVVLLLWGEIGGGWAAGLSDSLERAVSGLVISVLRLAAVALLATVAAEVYRDLTGHPPRHGGIPERFD